MEGRLLATLVAVMKEGEPLEPEVVQMLERHVRHEQPMDNNELAHWLVANGR